MSIFSELDNIASNNIDTFLPEKEERKYSTQGWNKNAKEYLVSLGYSKETIDRFYFLLDRHTQGFNVNSELSELLKENKELVIDASKFEISSLKERNKEKIKKLQNLLNSAEEELKEEVPDWLASREDDKNRIIEEREEKVKELEEELRDFKNTCDNPVVYRKGNIGKLILSWTPEKNGATFSGKSSDGEYSYRLTPDRSSRLYDLINEGIYPVAGYGVKLNMYEDEVTFINVHYIL